MIITVTIIIIIIIIYLLSVSTAWSSGAKQVTLLQLQAIAAGSGVGSPWNILGFSKMPLQLTKDVDRRDCVHLYNVLNHSTLHCIFRVLFVFKLNELIDLT